MLANSRSARTPGHREFDTPALASPMKLSRALSQLLAAVVLALLAAFDRLVGVPFPLASGAAYTLTAANVVPTANSSRFFGIAGETITAGQPVYKSATDGKLYLVDANDATKIAIVGLAINSAAAGQTLGYTDNDATFTHGLATTAAGDVIVCGSTAGALNPSADIASTWYPIVVGVAISATQMVLRIIQGTAAKA